MTYRSTEQLKATAETLRARLTAINAEIRKREAGAFTKLAQSYVKTLVDVAKASGGELPTPEQLAKLLKPAPKRPRVRKPKAEA